MAEWIQGTVSDNIHWTENLYSLKIDAEVDNFTAGQFTSLALDIDGERIARPYSFLSAPAQRPLEFFFYTATGGVLSNAMLGLKPGDHIWLKKKANGFFTLAEVPDSRDLWLFGTGTGIAPFFSILKTEEPWRRFEKVILVHGVRTAADLRYHELIGEIQQCRGDKFQFKAFVTREDVPGTYHGRIPAAIADGNLENACSTKLSIEDSQIMLCGNPDMVKDAVEILKERGFKKNRRRTPGQITVENYW
ncbi:MAG TPA: ferredoxin--NADP(+) reductase [Gammaproteobacteria bacterium]|jgi:ferredoxin--NADP+ reductase|nr:ferredoxin--NADP reductase [Gammaproteobacteria bacterium]MDB3908396.1 ferredoxin--NADP reductase [Gammaproteobacteria bacterium]HAS49663.1 ferredoxin--NADP(+) reductase [Gammaproteobacteria bacterium]